MSDLVSKVAVVTGGSRGIGKATVRRLLEEGCRVAFCGTQEKVLEQTAEDLKGGENLFYTVVDVSQEESVKKFAEAVLNRWGQVDILVNNAGIVKDGLLLRMTKDDWQHVLDVNLKGAFLMTRAFVRPMMKKRWGRIVNVTSIVGIRGNTGQANYAASKAGLIGLTKTVAQEFAGRGITCNAVAPGFIETDMTAGLDEKMRQGLLEKIPLGFLGKPEDVSETIAFLVSEKARYITGQVICVDGGMIL